MVAVEKGKKKKRKKDRLLARARGSITCGWPRPCVSLASPAMVPRAAAAARTFSGRLTTAYDHHRRLSVFLLPSTSVKSLDAVADRKHPCPSTTQWSLLVPFFPPQQRSEGARANWVLTILWGSTWLDWQRRQRQTNSRGPPLPLYTPSQFRSISSPTSNKSQPPIHLSPQTKISVTPFTCKFNLCMGEKKRK